MEHQEHEAQNCRYVIVDDRGRTITFFYTLSEAIKCVEYVRGRGYIAEVFKETLSDDLSVSIQHIPTH